MEKILDTIKKLQRLAERAGTTHEAAEAAARIQALLFKHNLTMTAVEAHDDDGPARTYGVEQITLAGGRFNVGWHRRLLGVVARFNFCDTVGHTGQTTASIIGQPHNVEVVTYLYTYLAREIHRLGTEQMRTKCPSPYPGAQGAWVRTFALGAIAEIGARLYHQREQDRRASAASTALVHVTDAALKAAVAEHFPRVRKTSIGAGRGREAYDLGRAAGRRIALNPALGRAGAGPRPLR